MSISNLSAKEMLGLSGAWLDPSRSRATLANHRRTAHLLDDLQSAHDGLLRETDVTPGDPPPALTTLLSDQITQDALHDRKARGVSLVLEGLVELADEDEQRSSIVTAQRTLFPQGLSFINLSYTAEAGNVEATSQRFDQVPLVQSALGAATTPWGTSLLAEVQAWFQAGRDLARLDAERVQMTPAPTPARATGSGRPARNRWLTLINTMLSNVALDPTIDADLERDVLGPLREAEARADGRAARKKKPAALEETLVAPPPVLKG